MFGMHYYSESPQEFWEVNYVNSQFTDDEPDGQMKSYSLLVILALGRLRS